MKYSFTGTTSTRGQLPRIRAREAMATLRDGTVFTTGAAYGMDTVLYEEAYAAYPKAVHQVFYPEGLRHNEELVALARARGHTVVPVPGGYMARNDALVAQAEVLVAFPVNEKETLRSGTWATVRRARKANVPVRINPLYE